MAVSLIVSEVCTVWPSSASVLFVYEMEAPQSVELPPSGQRTGPRLCPHLLPWDFRTDSRIFSLAPLPLPLTLKLRGHARQRRSEPRTRWPQHTPGWVGGQDRAQGTLRKPTFAMLERYVFLLSLLTNTVTSVKSNTHGHY